ncbi:MAG: glycosyltransferase family 39 protein [Candidatus Omnitrophota bacterium]
MDKRASAAFVLIYFVLFIAGIAALFHGFPDTERFFAEWMDERITLTTIMKFGTLNFAPTQIMHPPLYHYLTFIPIALFFATGKLIGFFHDKMDFVRFYFNNTHYFFFIGRLMSYIFYWSAAVFIYRMSRLLYSRTVSHLGVIAYLLIPRFIFDFSTARPEPLLFLTSSVFFYFFLKYCLDNADSKSLLMSAFMLGVSIAVKYNAAYLGSAFAILFAQQSVKKRGFDKGLTILYMKAALLVFLGFFICDPFFIIQFNKYFHNLRIYGIEMKYYWKGDFGRNHLLELGSLLYLNYLGLAFLAMGAWNLFKRHRGILAMFFLVTLVYEVYFGISFKNYAPLRYLNPIMPIAILTLSAGIDLMLNSYRKALAALAVFFVIIAYNYFDIWQGMAFGQTHIQKARSFIEKTVSELSVICIASNNYLPQLSMTRESYDHLVATAPPAGNIEGHELAYRGLDKESDYDGAFKGLRIEGLAKKPRYNLVRWDGGIITKEQAAGFLRGVKAEYVVSSTALILEGKRLEDTGIASLIKEFRPRNPRIYKAVFSGVDLGVFIYKVN